MLFEVSINFAILFVLCISQVIDLLLICRQDGPRHLLTVHDLVFPRFDGLCVHLLGSINKHIGVPIAVIASKLRLKDAWVNRRHGAVVELIPIFDQALLRVWNREITFGVIKFNDLSILIFVLFILFLILFIIFIWVVLVFLLLEFFLLLLCHMLFGVEFLLDHLSWVFVHLIFGDAI